MIMKKIYSLAIVLAAFAQVARAQGINQSVQVTNKYETQFSEMKKLGPEISAPDSLLRFDYKFDYSVFDTEYKGAYEFTPYLIEMKPDASLYDGRKGMLKVGAGYFIHPELMFAYSPLDSKDAGITVWSNAGGFFQDRNDYDLSGKLGVDGRILGKHMVTTLGLEYDGIFNSSWQSEDMLNTAAAKLRMKSLREGSFFFYDFNLGYRFASASFRNLNDGSRLGHIIDFHGSAGPVFRNKYRILVDLDAKVDLESGHSASNSYLFAVTPHILLLPGQFHADLGARIDYSSGLTVSPQAEVGFRFAKGSHYLYAGFSGGQRLLTYYDLKTANHRMDYLWKSDLRQVEREKMNAFIGLNGHVGNFFQYRIKGGYASWGGRLFETLYPLSLGTGHPSDDMIAVYSSDDFNAAYAKLDLSWESERVSVLLNTDITVATSEIEMGFAPALASGTLSIDYKWLKRIRAGISVEGRTNRKAFGMPWVEDIPAYADLGLNFHYLLSRSFGLWAKGGNLACMKIQRVPGFVEKGPYATLGISVIF